MSFHEKGEIFSMTSARMSVLFPLRMGMCKSSFLTVLWNKQTKTRIPSWGFGRPYQGGFPTQLFWRHHFSAMKCLPAWLIQPALSSLVEVVTSSPSEMLHKSSEGLVFANSLPSIRPWVSFRSSCCESCPSQKIPNLSQWPDAFVGLICVSSSCSFPFQVFPRP